METVMHSKTSTINTESSEKIKAASAPIFLLPSTSEAAKLTIQISAPSYLHSLKENKAPPFRRPVHEAQPKLLIETLVTENDCIEIIAQATGESLKKALGDFLVKKKIVENYNLPEKNFLISFLTETIDYAAQRHFPPDKLACLMAMYLATHNYFKWYYWMAPINVWKYFKEIMIRHTIEDSPDGQEVFEPEECYDIVSHFHTVYISNLPLVHLVTFGSYRLKLLWPFKLK
ncbi:unnamed protein product [Leptosia nina]|uniref:Uncharacterized protein n=1 Tax=Leptosia nina TaxID=320188 RepID=A0AAV1JJU6_9NEOP